jgi:hypothetical protein
MNLQGLPSDLKKQAASFLSAKDAHSLNQTSRALHADLCLSTLSPAFQLYSNENWYGDVHTGDLPRRGSKIPIFFGSSVHSIVLTCLWSDQGWGNRKGELFVLAFPDNDNQYQYPSSNNLSFLDGRLVYRSQVARHEEESLKCSFNPRRNEIYYIWFKAGGGGGHELRLRNLLVHTVVFDDRDRTLANTFQALSNMGVVSLPTSPPPPTNTRRLSTGQRQPQENPPFNSQLVLLAVIIASLKAAISRNEAPDLILSQFLASNGIEVNEATLTAVEGLVHYIQQQYRPVVEQHDAAGNESTTNDGAARAARAGGNANIVPRHQLMGHPLPHNFAALHAREFRDRRVLIDLMDESDDSDNGDPDGLFDQEDDDDDSF